MKFTESDIVGRGCTELEKLVVGKTFIHWLGLILQLRMSRNTIRSPIGKCSFWRKTKQSLIVDDTFRTVFPPQVFMVLEVSEGISPSNCLHKISRNLVMLFLRPNYLTKKAVILPDEGIPKS